MNTTDLAELHPVAFEKLPAVFRNDQTTFYWELYRNVVCARPRNGQESNLGRWVALFSHQRNEWIHSEVLTQIFYP